MDLPPTRGFFPGRSILANVVDVEEAALQSAMAHDMPATFLFDFSAAFPSVNQEYPLRALSHVGLPLPALHAVRALYDNNRCRLAFAGALWGGFAMSSGIRQGCPLSRCSSQQFWILFVRHLQRLLPGQAVRAYADDIAAVVHDIEAAAPLLVREFQRLAQATNLVLNVSKTICIPLRETSLSIATDKLKAACEQWAEITVADTGKYLGFYIGPGKAQLSWTAAGQKMLSRARSWDYSRFGLYYATCAHNLYVSSLPSYIGQLESYLDEFHQEVEEATLRRAAAGPYAWALPQDLFRLKDCYGQAANFRSLRHATLAAKVRVCRFENQAHGGLRVRTRARQLRALVATSKRTVRAATWNDWIQNNPLLVLDGALNHCSTLGCTILAVENRTAGPRAQRPHTPPQATRVRQQFQSTLSFMLRKKEPYDEEHRMRHKPQRWNLMVLPRWAAARALNKLSYLHTRSTASERSGLVHPLEQVDHRTQVPVLFALLPGVL